jgi:chemotaxis signal transduction protein
LPSLLQNKLRKRFGLAERELHLSEHIILAHTLKRVVALVVDAVRSKHSTNLTWHILGLFQGQSGARQWRQYLSTHAHRRGAGVEVIAEALRGMASV